MKTRLKGLVVDTKKYFEMDPLANMFCIKRYFHELTETAEEIIFKHKIRKEKALLLTLTTTFDQKFSIILKMLPYAKGSEKNITFFGFHRCSLPLYY